MARRCRYRHEDKQGGGGRHQAKRSQVEDHQALVSPAGLDEITRKKGGNGALDVARSDGGGRCYRRTCTRAALSARQQPGGAAAEKDGRASHMLASATDGGATTPPPASASRRRRQQEEDPAGSDLSPSAVICPFNSSLIPRAASSPHIEHVWRAPHHLSSANSPEGLSEPIRRDERLRPSGAAGSQTERRGEPESGEKPTKQTNRQI